MHKHKSRTAPYFKIHEKYHDVDSSSDEDEEVCDIQGQPGLSQQIKTLSRLEKIGRERKRICSDNLAVVTVKESVDDCGNQNKEVKVVEPGKVNEGFAVEDELAGITKVRHTFDLASENIVSQLSLALALSRDPVGSQKMSYSDCDSYKTFDAPTALNKMTIADSIACWSLIEALKNIPDVNDQILCQPVTLEEFSTKIVPGAKVCLPEWAESLKNQGVQIHVSTNGMKNRPIVTARSLIEYFKKQIAISPENIDFPNTKLAGFDSYKQRLENTIDQIGQDINTTIESIGSHLMMQ